MYYIQFSFDCKSFFNIVNLKIEGLVGAGFSPGQLNLKTRALKGRGYHYKTNIIKKGGIFAALFYKK